MTDAALQVKALDFTYPGAANASLNGLSLNVPQGSLFGLLGPNGAGKTTLLSLIGAQQFCPRGSLFVHGKDIRSIDRRSLSLVPQDYAFYLRMTVLENLNFFARIQRLRGSLARERIAQAVDTAQLAALLGNTAASLSGGQKRRLNLAIGLLNQPSLLLLDEPTVGIDPQSRRHILETVRAINAAGTTVVYTSHYMEEVEYLCSDIAIIDHGRQIAGGSRSELREHYGEHGLEQLFMTLTDTALRA